MEYRTGIKEPWKRFGATEEDWHNWRWQARNSFTDPDQLSEFLGLTDLQAKMVSDSVDRGKRMRIPPYDAALMGPNPTGVDKRGNSISNRINGVFLQGVPTPAHHLFKAGQRDPMAEGSRSYGAVYQRYPDRVALFVSKSGDCHFYCMHCQRDKDIVSSGQGPKEMNIGLDYIRANENIREVLATGGDALVGCSEKLEYVLKSLSEIGHIEAIRIATRLPVTNPFAVTDEKLGIIERYSKHTGGRYDLPEITMVTHSNSPDEHTLDMQEAVSGARRHGLTVRNQSVLLKGVNDDLPTLSELCTNLYHMGAQPYYIFQCHKVDGLASMIVPINVGQYLVNHLRGQEGLSIPNYAVNMTGGGGKVVLTPEGDKGVPDFGYPLEREMWTWDSDLQLYDELLHVRQRDFEMAMDAMSAFYGDPKIKEYSSSGDIQGIQLRETLSKKFRPSVVVVEDSEPRCAKYVTNVAPPKILTKEEKCQSFGLVPNGKEFGLEVEYVTNPYAIQLGAGLSGTDKPGRFQQACYPY
ncbi:MAG: KamA family radical SAM protein [Candidatus Aenigmarchaeota archaeon]|nr:KamA family radical SAM protein [Candidatus Aenigmarchaeota archaeon]